MTALELTALALTSRLFGRPRDREPVFQEPVVGDTADVAEMPPPRAAPIPVDSGDQPDEWYRATDHAGELLAAFYSDGRVRLTGGDRSFAGIVKDGQADLLDVTDNTWSELFVRSTPQGQIQLEIRGGAFAGRIFTCAPVAASQLNTAP